MTEQIPQQSPAPLPPLTPEEERQWAMLAHLGVLANLFSGFLGPIVPLAIYMIYKERSRYVAYQSMQALIFQLIWWVGGGALTGIAWAITGALSAVIIGLLCIPFACVISAMPLVALIYGVYAGIQCNQGQDFKYWLIGDWFRNILTD
ncbi:MAG: DUF4870 domain-containing protein [Anaerolineales bacterium]|jgi:uncharacterized Tic20 family protein|uniref:DUF4870 domain-containing protein n=1 Tax=Candidatus Villigracilis vicinus TaxID=3140679 RepID=UPI0031347680|nr:DUF4870 domain-containing protein [Anaerolineales bacterium]MBK7448904.1 DUF4870 domain-containing protein [Anaerolineales bacterium]MBK9778537.1 DUF4870 domain-containing protein [Anaerolineales bacterium]